MEPDRLLRPDGPWLSLVVASASEAYDRARALDRAKSRHVAARVLRGRKMRTAGTLFDEFAAALQFPPYFGENWDAFEECLGDLEWLPADVRVLVILDAAVTLDRAAPEEGRLFREIVERIARESARPAGGDSPRSGSLLRVVLQCAPEDADLVRSAWPAAADLRRA